MFDQIITTVENLGLEFTEDYEAGTLVIDIAGADKADLVAVIQVLNDEMLDFDIDESAITVHGGAGEFEDFDEDEEDFEDFNLDELGSLDF